MIVNVKDVKRIWNDYHYQQQNQSDTFNHQNQQNSNLMLPVTINGGPLSYSYLFHSLHIHFGLVDSYGSEHLISGFQFPGEVC